MADLKERGYWNDYQKAYEDVLNKCSTPWAPWRVIPADKKWYRNLLVAQTLVAAFNDLKMEQPKPSFDVAKVKID